LVTFSSCGKGEILSSKGDFMEQELNVTLDRTWQSELEAFCSQTGGKYDLNRIVNEALAYWYENASLGAMVAVLDQDEVEGDRMFLASLGIASE
jgi:hypothetical protein